MFNWIKDYLEKNLSGAVTNSVIFSNPVKDFLDLKSPRIEDNFKRPSANRY